jgi:hypothetical protein
MALARVLPDAADARPIADQSTSKGYCHSKWITGTRCFAANATIVSRWLSSVPGDEHRIRRALEAMAV